MKNTNSHNRKFISGMLWKVVVVLFLIIAVSDFVAEKRFCSKEENREFCESIEFKLGD